MYTALYPSTGIHSPMLSQIFTFLRMERPVSFVSHISMIIKYFIMKDDLFPYLAVRLVLLVLLLPSWKFESNDIIAQSPHNVVMSMSSKYHI
jgi:hypothetical protein